MALEPKNPEALYALGRLYAMQNRYPEAVERLETAVRIDPHYYKGLGQPRSLLRRAES